jgi:hypothetical protein
MSVGRSAGVRRRSRHSARSSSLGTAPVRLTTIACRQDSSHVDDERWPLIGNSRADRCTADG